jgi:hypothetical protein
MPLDDGVSGQVCHFTPTRTVRLVGFDWRWGSGIMALHGEIWPVATSRRAGRLRAFVFYAGSAVTRSISDSIQR